jgi:hypothetical protein
VDFVLLRPLDRPLVQGMLNRPFDQCNGCFFHFVADDDTLEDLFSSLDCFFNFTHTFL